MKRALFIALAAVILGTSLSYAQAPPARDGSDNDIHLIDVTLRDLIARAYQLAPQQIFGPAWLDASRLDMVAHVPPGMTRDQAPQVLQNALAERFKLAAHRESRTMAVFLLEVAPGGAKLDQTPAWDKREPECEHNPFGSQNCRAVSMADLAARLQNEWPGIAPIVDRTGLTGTYDFGLKSITNFRLGVQRDSPIVFKVQSMQDQLKSLGLTIVQQKQPVEVLIVDHCEKKPIGN